MKTILQKAYRDKVAAEKNFILRPDFNLLEISIDKDAFIVDWGCGYERTLDELYLAGYRNMPGLDFSVEMIARGQKSFPCLNLQIVDNLHTNLPDNSVDLMKNFNTTHFAKTQFKTMNGYISNGFVLLQEKSSYAMD